MFEDVCAFQGYASLLDVCLPLYRYVGEHVYINSPANILCDVLRTFNV